MKIKAFASILAYPTGRRSPQLATAQSASVPTSFIDDDNKYVSSS